VTSRKQLVVRVGLVLVAVLVLAWLFITTIRNTNSAPYEADASQLTGWQVVPGQGSEPGVAALALPSQFSAELFRQLFERTMQSLVAPTRPVVPLVLTSEYADSLQGVHSVDNIMNIAREAGLETARFEPVCVAERTDSAPGRTSQVFFVVFESPAFSQFRANLMPTQPEHGGTGAPYQPAALRPILMVASTDRDFGRWWPLRFNQQEDCQAPVELARD
jgi:hypothetical protein